MEVKATMTERSFNLVVPLAHEANDIFSQKHPSTATGLTRFTNQDYLSPVVKTKTTGIGVPNWSGEEPLCSRKRLFCRLGMPYGRPGGRSRKARRCSIGTPTSVSVAHPIGVGLAVTNRNWSNIMADNTRGATAPELETRNHQFARANADGKLLFAINDGVPLIDALEMAQCYLISAKEITAQTAMNFAQSDGSDSLYGAHYLCVLACAVLSSVVSAATNERNGMRP
jgi:hypothetical protein